MADISAEIAAFKNAVYGEDVRDAMVSLANKLNNVITQAVSTANDIFSKRTVLSTTDDLNTLTNEGIYYYNTNALPANAPEGNTDGATVLHFGGAKFALQIVGNRYYKWVRFKGSSAWYQWNRIASYDYVDAQINSVTNQLANYFKKFERTLSSSDDLNDFHGQNYNGVYICSRNSKPQNYPSAFYGGYLLIFNEAQIIFYSSAPYNIFYRFHYGNGNAEWTEWSNVIKSNNVLDFLPAVLINKGVYAGNYNFPNDVSSYGIFRINVGQEGLTNFPFNESGISIHFATDAYRLQLFMGPTILACRFRGASQWYPWIYLNGSGNGTTISNIPQLRLSGSTAGMSKDVSVGLSYMIFNLSGTATVKWQGSSSTRYPKKNYTIKFDNGFDAKNLWTTAVNSLRSAAGNISTLDTTSRWGSRKKYCTKANWIDASQSRNIVCARLWGQMVKDRIDNNEVTDARTDSPNYGAIDGYPIEIVLNDNSTGLYTINIPKDPWMLAMGTASTEYMVTAENSGSSACKFNSLAVMDGSDFEIEYAQDGVEDSVVKASFNNLIQATLDTTDAASYAYLANYMDIGSAIDYLILSCIINHYDGLPHNIIYGTYDGIKWFFSAYDMDTTFGSDAYGSNYYKVRNNRCSFTTAGNTHNLLKKVMQYDTQAVVDRYDELVSGILSEENIWYEFTNFMTEISDNNLIANNSIWPQMPGTSMAKVDTYMNFYRMHRRLLDSEIDDMR